MYVALLFFELEFMLRLDFQNYIWRNVFLPQQTDVGLTEESHSQSQPQSQSQHQLSQPSPQPSPQKRSNPKKRQQK